MIPNTTMPRPVPSFQGQLVTLRMIDPVIDAQGYYEMYAEPEMHLWTYNEPFESIKQTQAELERFVSMDEYSFWTILDNPTGKVAGRYHIHMGNNNNLSIVRVGVRIAKPFWRKGHHKETQRLIFPYIFNELNSDSIESWAWDKNINSIKSMESSGFGFDHEEQEMNIKHKRILSKRYYVLTKEKWLSIRDQNEN